MDRKAVRDHKRTIGTRKLDACNGFEIFYVIFLCDIYFYDWKRTPVLRKCCHITSFFIVKRCKQTALQTIHLKVRKNGNVKYLMPYVVNIKASY